MWFLVAGIIGAFVLSFLFAPKMKIENARAATLNEFKFPRSKEGDPVPRIYGTVKTRSPNSIYVGDFEAQPIKKKVKTGLFSSKKQIVGYKYMTGLDLAVALGPCVTYRRMGFGKNEVWNGCITACTEVTEAEIDLPDLYGGKDRNGGVGGTVRFYSGNFDQSQDAYLIAQLGAGVPAYIGVSHVVFEHFWFGNSPNIEAIWFEVSHFSNSLELDYDHHIMPNRLDINPVEMLHDLYVNDWGNLDVEPGLIGDSWWAAAEVVFDEGNGASAEIANPQDGKEITREVLRQINGVVYNDPALGTIELALIRNDYVIGELTTLGPSQIEEVRDYTKKLWEDTINRVRVKYQDREASYKDDAIAVADDFANIRYQDRVRPADIGMPFCKTAALANALAARELSNLNVPLFTAELVCNRTVIDLRPGDVFILTWPEYNILQMVVRIRKFDLGTRDDGKITMVVTQDEFAVDATVYADPEPPILDDGDYSAQDIESYAIFELPYFLAIEAELGVEEGFTNYAAFAARPGGSSLDYFMLVDDPDEDVEVLSDAPYTATATLANWLDRWEGFEDGYIAELLINNVSEPGILTDSDLAGVRTGANLFLLNGELMSYETFTDNGGGSYTLEVVHRSMIDTGWEEHQLGDTLFFFDGQEGFAEDAIAIAPFDAYLLDRSIHGRSAEADATLEALTPVGRALLPAPPDWVTIEGVRTPFPLWEPGDTVTVDWSERSRLEAELGIEADASGTPEGSTTYKIEVLDDDGNVLFDDDAIATNTYELTLPADYEGGLIVQVWAETAAGLSFSAAPFPLIVTSTDLLVTEGDDFYITEDGDYRVMED